MGHLKKLKQKMLSYGINPPDHFEYERFTRYAGNPEEPKKKDSWYILHPIGTKGHLVATFGDWRLLPDGHKWDSFEELPKERKEDYKKIIDKQKRLFKEEKEKRQIEASKKAFELAPI